MKKLNPRNLSDFPNLTKSVVELRLKPKYSKSRVYPYIAPCLLIDNCFHLIDIELTGNSFWLTVCSF